MTASTLPLWSFESSTLARLEKPRIDFWDTELHCEPGKPLPSALRTLLLKSAGSPECRFFVLKNLIHRQPRHASFAIANGLPIHRADWAHF